MGSEDRRELTVLDRGDQETGIVAVKRRWVS